MNNKSIKNFLVNVSLIVFYLTTYPFDTVAKLLNTPVIPFGYWM
jgi:hypothetical protein